MIKILEFYIIKKFYLKNFYFDFFLNLCIYEVLKIICGYNDGKFL